MQLDDVDFLRRTLTVSRQVQQRARNPREVRAPKYGSERTVYLPQGLVDMLAAHVAIGVRPQGWLFVGAGDGPPHQNTVRDWWSEALVQREQFGVAAPDDAGVVEHQIQSARARHHVIDGGLHCGGVGDVEATRGCGARSG